MILYKGQLLPDGELDVVLDSLWDTCLDTVMHREMIWEKVILACNGVAERLKNGAYDAVSRQLLEKGVVTSKQIEEVPALFERENLRLKYETELGRYRTEIERDKNSRRTKRLEPLGILFHIAAGNAQGLPFYSVLEGLLAGNVNILKLPSMDDGISIMLLHEMIKEEPALAPYVCVLDVPSTNLHVMKKLADEGLTMMIVTHEMAFVKEIATRVLFVDQHKIIEEGTPEEIFNNPKTERLKEFLSKI